MLGRFLPRFGTNLERHLQDWRQASDQKRPCDTENPRSIEYYFLPRESLLVLKLVSSRRSTFINCLTCPGHSQIIIESTLGNQIIRWVLPFPPRQRYLNFVRQSWKAPVNAVQWNLSPQHQHQAYSTSVTVLNVANNLPPHSAPQPSSLTSTCRLTKTSPISNASLTVEDPWIAISATSAGQGFCMLISWKEVSQRELR